MRLGASGEFCAITARADCALSTRRGDKIVHQHVGGEIARRGTSIARDVSRPAQARDMEVRVLKTSQQSDKANDQLKRGIDVSGAKTPLERLAAEAIRRARVATSVHLSERAARVAGSRAVEEGEPR